MQKDIKGLRIIASKSIVGIIESIATADQFITCVVFSIISGFIVCVICNIDTDAI
jgi:hypothetical protein